MDEDNDVDIDSELDDEDDYGGDNQGINISNMSEAERRAHHNRLERQRRDQIKDSFSSLRDVIPNLHGERASRAKILQSATDYIKEMGHRTSGINRDIEDLRKTNRQLEQQVKAMERTVPAHKRGGGGGSDSQLVPHSPDTQFRSLDVGLRNGDSSDEDVNVEQVQGPAASNHYTSGSAARPRKRSRLNNT